jgi:hypothetical protein
MVAFGKLLGIGVIDTSPAFKWVQHVTCLRESCIGWAATGVPTVVGCNEVVEALEFFFCFIQHHVVKDVCLSCLG